MGGIGADIAIVGMAAVFPGAPDLATYRANIRAGVDAITDVPANRWGDGFYDPDAAKERPGDRMYCRRGGFVAPPMFDPMRFGIMPMAVADIEPDQLITLATAAAAIDDAGGPDRLGDRSKVGIVLGRGGYFTPGMATFVDRVRTANQLAVTLRELLPDLTEEQAEAVRAAFAERLGPIREESGIDLMVPNLVASRTANRLDLAGPAYTIDAACASSLIAVDSAIRELASGRCDVVLAGGVHHCHDITFWSGFNLLGALSHSQRIRPFHRDADGILIGEGTGIVVLKRLADAADDRVYAVIRGTGVAGDGRSASLMAPQSSGQVAAMTQAWAAAGLDPAEPGCVGLVEAHGTATTAGDATELASLTQLFGPQLTGSGNPGGPDIGLGSVKSMIGHAMPAAGVAGLIKAALAVHDGTLPPTLHCEEPHPALAGTRFSPVTSAQAWESAGPRRAAVNAFGFGGINAHAVLEQAPGVGAVVPPTVSAAPRGERVLRLAGPDAASIARQLEASDDALLSHDEASDINLAGVARLAVVAPDPKRLALARKVVAQGRPWRGRSDLWFTDDPLLGPGGGRTAFLFPGLEQVFAPRVDDVSAHFGLPPVRLEDVAIETGSGLGRRGLELAGVGRLLDAALRRLGVLPDAVAGHSIGEWSALIAAGVTPYEAFASSTRAFDAGPGGPDLVFAALGCGAEVAAVAIADLPEVVVTHDNCPHQSIICGEPGQVDVALVRLRGDGVTGSVLPFRSGFHTPMLAPYLGPTRDYISALELRAPSVPVWSATTVEPYPHDDAAVRALLLRNLTEPVRFGPLIRRLYDAGVRAFVQVGTGSLPGFVEDTLDSVDPSRQSTPHLVVSANAPRRTGLEQLRRVAAALWAEGAEPDFAALSPPLEPARPSSAGGRARTAEPPAAATPAPAPSRPGMALRMGAPLVHLDGRPDIAPAAAPGPVPRPAAGLPAAAAGSAVLAEFQGLLGEAQDAAASVVEAWASGAPPAGGALAAGPSGFAARLPDTPTGPRTRTTHRVMSLETDPYLADHCLLQGPVGRAAGAELFPIVPMTATIELMIRAAAELVPGRRVIGVRGVRALRPVAVVPPIELIVEATERPDPGPRGEPASRADAVGLTVVGVALDGRVATPDGSWGHRESYARATVLLADAYPSPPPLRQTPLAGEEPSDVDAVALYADRWMFHGPAYQGVVELGGIGEHGVRGVVTAPDVPGGAAPGAMLDAAGQLLGFWVTIQPENQLVLPATIGSISFYGPDPAPGARMATVVRVRSASAEEAVADLELRDAAGRLWCHITGWTDRRLQTDETTIAAFRHPDRALLARPQDGGWVLLAEPWTDMVARDLCMRQYLAPAEQEAYAARNPRAARHWLLGRIAAKDAVRAHLWARGAGPIFPAEVVIANAESGRPYAEGPDAAGGLTLSLAHSGPLAAALVGPAGPLPGTGVGIDVELVDDAPTESALLTPAERALLDSVCPAGGTSADGTSRAAWVTRFWTAKEAVAKAAGTGLEGRPGRFVVIRVEDDRLLVDVDGARRWVSTRSADTPVPYAVGWTLGTDVVGEGEDRP